MDEKLKQKMVLFNRTVMLKQAQFTTDVLKAAELFGIDYKVAILTANKIFKDMTADMIEKIIEAANDTKIDVALGKKDNREVVN